MEKTLHLLIMYTMFVLMVILLHKGRKVRSSLFLAAYALVEVITNSVDGIALIGNINVLQEYPLIPYFAKPIALLWVPLFYLYVRSNFSKLFIWKKILLLHFLPFVLAFCTYTLLFVIKGVASIRAEMFQLGSPTSYSLYLVDIVLKIQYLLYSGYMIYQLITYEKQIKNGREAQTPVPLYWLRFIVYGYAVACMGAIFTFIMFHYNWSFASKVNIASILYFFLFFFVLFYHTIVTKTTIKKKKNKPAEENDELEFIMKRLEQYLIEEKAFLNAELNLKYLADKIQIKDRSISQAINTLQKRNFKDYINSFRIAYACELLKQEEEKPIFEIMYESGFNTKGPFNTAFKKETGHTPSSYRSLYHE